MRGTLDPLATGVLPIALGEATKTVRLRDGRPQTLSLPRSLGRRAQHRRRRGRDCRPNARRGRAARRSRRYCPASPARSCRSPPALLGDQGRRRRAYALARAGVAVRTRRANGRDRRLRLIAVPDRDHADFEAQVGKGTYIRALARDLGRGARNVRPCRRAAPARGRAVSPKRRRFHWIPWSTSAIVCRFGASAADRDRAGRHPGAGLDGSRSCSIALRAVRDAVRR